MQETARKLRSSGPLPDTKVITPKVDESTLPHFTYSGQIKYYTDLIDCAFVCDQLLKKANNSVENLVLGFDIEWPFSFQTGSKKTSLVQISPSLDICYLLQVSQFNKLPVALTELLSHRNVRLTGVNIKNDIRKLSRDFPGICPQQMLENCIDLRPMAKMLVESSGSFSMESLIKRFFSMQINKDKKVRQSKWDILPLSSDQIQYAATDAYASLKLYLHLKDQLEQSLIKKSV